MPPVDSSVLTPKELDSMKATLPKTSEEIATELARDRYLYPKHVEVIRDFEPVVDKAVDKILLETGEFRYRNRGEGRCSCV